MKIVLGTLFALALSTAPVLAQAQQTTPDPNASASGSPQNTAQLDNTASQNKAMADAANKKAKAAKKAANANKKAAKEQNKTTDAQQKAAAANAANAATPAPQ